MRNWSQCFSVDDCFLRPSTQTPSVSPHHAKHGLCLSTMTSPTFNLLNSFSPSRFSNSPPTQSCNPATQCDASPNAGAARTVVPVVPHMVQPQASDRGNIVGGLRGSTSHREFSAVGGCECGFHDGGLDGFLSRWICGLLQFDGAVEISLPYSTSLSNCDIWSGRAWRCGSHQKPPGAPKDFVGSSH